MGESLYPRGASLVVRGRSRCATRCRNGIDVHMSNGHYTGIIRWARVSAGHVVILLWSIARDTLHPVANAPGVKPTLCTHAYQASRLGADEATGEWRNWQTRWLQVPVSFTDVGVQVPLRPQ